MASLSVFRRVFNLVVVGFMLGTSAYGQRFLQSGISIPDFGGDYRVDSIKIPVSGLVSRIDSSFGLAKVCINVSHKRVSDLKIELLAPDGTSIWLTNRNGTEQGANYMNTCFRSNGFDGYIHAGKAPFIGEYIPDGRISFLNNGQNPNGDWYLLVQDLSKEVTGNVHYVSLEFSPEPNPHSGQGGCSFETPEFCKQAEGSEGGALLPDLVPLPFFSENQIHEYAQDDANYPGQLKLAISMANLGDGPLEVFGSHEWLCQGSPADSNTICPDGKNARQTLYQRVYSLSDDKKLTYHDRPSHTNYYDSKPGHNHYHVDDWVEFRLIELTKSKIFKKERVRVLTTSSKISYCLFDSGICNQTDRVCQVNGIPHGAGNLPNYGLGGYSACNSHRQGISVGAYDTYGMMYEGQYLDIPKGTKNGDYFIEVIIDPYHKIKEKNIENNTLRLPVTLTKQEG